MARKKKSVDGAAGADMGMGMKGVSAPDALRVENKLILLYLLDKMDLPLSRNQITEFAREGEYMDYYTLSHTLEDMVEGRYLDKMVDNNNTRYSITDEGATTLEYFESHIPAGIRTKINKYVKARFNSVKRDFEVTSNYFANSETGEFVVKCGVYESKYALMEISVSVVSREQAKLIQSNWKSDVSEIYMKILTVLMSEKAEGLAPEPAEKEQEGESLEGGAV